MLWDPRKEAGWRKGKDCGVVDTLGRTLAVFSAGLTEISIVKRVVTISTEALKNQRNPPLTVL